GGEGKGNDAHKHHDGAVHRAEHVIKVAADHAAVSGLVEYFFEQRTNSKWHLFAGIRQLPAHHHHQAEAEEEEEEAAKAVLDADDFVVGGKNVFPPKTEFLMIVRVIMSSMCDR